MHHSIKVLLALPLILSLNACVFDLAAAKAIWRNPDGSAITDCQGEPIHMQRRKHYQGYAHTDSHGMTHIQCPEANQVKIKFQQQS
ncbi:hypothetical protein LVJ82_14765 [Vitreoscilla massiliensis]|uniref:Lipoprotein n=1 Tax=Vitreoscilla massiliensis TaxID=1689272 RepID=A0ABY4E1P6_9NEIS|nr:hypothetical protein [Vitreoscilla massiliensis]UOO88710.1 hypothetical protein LVJ82_14765 [Vitreoscilla massiliensis]